VGIGSLRRYHAPVGAQQGKGGVKLEPGSVRGQGTPDEVHAAIDAANAAKVATEQSAQAKAAREGDAQSVYPTIQAKGRRKTTAEGKVSPAAETEAEVEGQPATSDEGTSQAEAKAAE
jgi:hypothetical protein